MATDLIQDGQQEGPAMVKVEEDHFYVQETDLQLNSQSSRIFHQRFRLFPYQETPGPREALRRLRELGRQWLSPEMHTKEQILQLLVLEQFLTILPAELQAWVRGQHLESGEQAVTVLEDLERLLDEPGEQGAFHADGQEVLWEEVTSLGAGCQSPCDQLQHVETTPPA